MFAFPWSIRRLFYRILFGYNLHKYSKIKYSLIFVKNLDMSERSRIGSFNLITNIDALKLGFDSGIGTFNYITGDPSYLKSNYSYIENRKCELVMQSHCGITSRHFIDCTAGIYLDDLTTIVGIHSQIFTHSIDIYKNRKYALPVVFGKGCLVGTGSIIMPGSKLPNYSILSASSLLNKSFETESFYMVVFQQNL
jgi:acetyltransferase-like isoleucine patch superfamily enzyme